MSKDQKGFITYGDFEAVADELTDEQLGKILRAELKYFNSGKAPKFDGILKYVWIPIQQQMDRDSESYEKKCAKMRANANKRWAKPDDSESMQLHPNDANTKTNTNTDTKTDTNTNTNTMSVPDASSLSSDLISYLNDKAGTSHKPTKTVVRQIQGLLDSGYTPFQIRTVIDKKCDEWLNDSKMRGYLRPSTLFGDKFDEYLSAPVSLRAEAERKRTESIEELRKRLEEKRTAMASISEAIEELRGDDGKFGDNLNEFRVLWDQKAILEDSIKQIEKRLEANAS